MFAAKLVVGRVFTLDQNLLSWQWKWMQYQKVQFGSKSLRLIETTSKASGLK
jgi:hypothetical protein